MVIQILKLSFHNAETLMSDEFTPFCFNEIIKESEEFLAIGCLYLIKYALQLVEQKMRSTTVDKNQARGTVRIM